MPVRTPKERLYVDVIARWNDDGRIDPLAICWPDGRTFCIDASSCAPVTYLSDFKHADVTTYSVKVGGKSVRLYLERQGPKASVLARWFVLVDAGKPLWKFNLDDAEHVYGARK